VQVFCGRIPKDVFEDELIPLFERCGKVWDVRLMMDPMTGYNRSFCFTTFYEKDGASEAVKQLNNCEIRPGKTLKVNISVANVRLFVGNIPKNKSKEEILDEFRKHTDGIVDVIIYNSPDDQKKKNRGFAFLEYDSHKSASMAKHRIGNGYTRVWGCDIIVDWADPQEEPDEETMSKVKVLYVRNLKSDVTEDQLREQFEQFGKVERVKKVKDYGFVHFEDRDNALRAMEQLNSTKIGESEMQISLAKPPTENKQKEKRKQMHKMQFMHGGYDDSWLPTGYPGMMHGPPARGAGRFFRPPGPPRAGYHGAADYEYGHGNYSGASYGGGGYDYYGGYEHDDYGYYGGGASAPYSEPSAVRGRGGRGAGPAMHRGAGHAGFWQPPAAHGAAWRPSWPAAGRGGASVGPGGAAWGGSGSARR
jgi:heterogeneous nuclear ribonucleoprotein R